MRGAVESRRLVQLDGVNANGVVAVAWIVSSFMAGLAGVLLAPVFGAFTSDNYVTLTVAAIAAAAWALLRSMPIAAGVAVLIGVVTTVLQGYIPPNSFFNSAVVPVAALPRPGGGPAVPARDAGPRLQPGPAGHHRPAAAADRGPGPGARAWTASSAILWWVVFAGFCVSMLTWIPITWTRRLQQRPGPLHRPALDHADHRHGGPALAVPGHLGRGGRLHGGPAGQPSRTEPAGRGPGRRASWPPPWRSSWPCSRCACAGWAWRS